MPIYGGTGTIYNSYTIGHTNIYGSSAIGSVDKNYGTLNMKNCYTLDASTKIIELNSGEDDIEGGDTEQPWIEDTNNINGGYPILAWQVSQ